MGAESGSVVSLDDDVVDVWFGSFHRRGAGGSFSPACEYSNRIPHIALQQQGIHPIHPIHRSRKQPKRKSSSSLSVDTL
jgi:hypothetical protein